MDLYLLISVRITGKIISTTAFLISILFNIFLKFLLKEKENDQDLENYQSLVMRSCVLLNMMALAMCLLVIMRNLIFFLKKPFFTFLGNVREYFVRMRANVTPIVTIEMEMSQIVEVVNVSEQNNTTGNNNWISLDIKESIRLVVLKESLDP